MRWRSGCFMGMWLATLGVWLWSWRITPEPLPKVVAANHIEAPDLSKTEKQLVSAVNTARGDHGLAVVHADAAVTDIARQRAADMVKRRYYAHKDPDGLFYYDLLEKRGVPTGYSCENLELEATFSAAQFVNAWLESAPHRNCLLHKQPTRLGVAVAKIRFENQQPMYLAVLILSTATQ